MRSHRTRSEAPQGEAGGITFSDRRQGMIFLVVATVAIAALWSVILVI